MNIILKFTLLLSCLFSSNLNDHHMCKTSEESTINSIVEDTLQFNLDGDIILVPTQFTPENIGSNTLFYPIFENDKIAISQFVVNTIEDDSKDVKLMYSTSRIIYHNNEVQFGWDGSDSRNQLAKIDHEGLFRFKFYASKAGSFMRCEGVAYLSRAK